MPFSSFLQYWQTVGSLYEWTTKVCGTRIRSANSFSTQAGRPETFDWEELLETMLVEVDICRRSRTGDVPSKLLFCRKKWRNFIRLNYWYRKPSTMPSEFVMLIEQTSKFEVLEKNSQVCNISNAVFSTFSEQSSLILFSTWLSHSKAEVHWFTVLFLIRGIFQNYVII